MSPKTADIRFSSLLPGTRATRSTERGHAGRDALARFRAVGALVSLSAVVIVSAIAVILAVAALPIALLATRFEGSRPAIGARHGWRPVPVPSTARRR